MTRFLIVNDEHELYDVMYADLFRAKEYDIQQINRFMPMPKILQKLNNVHFGDRINRHIRLPFKGIWNHWYSIDHYNFNQDEQYWIIFLNGTLRNFYSYKYLNNFKSKHPNVRLAMVMYDSFSNKSATKAIKMMPIFDKVFSFDAEDCHRYSLEFIYSTFSYPSFVKHDERFHKGAFFVGAEEGRLEIMEQCFAKISSVIPNCQFNVVGVPPRKQHIPEVITYNVGMSYKEALQYSFNSDLIVEIVREGQSGISLRTCEAILFNKKLLTNNEQIKNMPFYDSRYMSVFHNSDDIDIEFVKNEMDVHYDYQSWFSPFHIIEKLNGD